MRSRLAAANDQADEEANNYRKDTRAMIEQATRTIPICRCPRCGARWVIQRVRATDEHGTPMYCHMCGEEYLWEDGRVVPITRHATPATLAEMRHERHALAVEASTITRRAAR